MPRLRLRVGRTVRTWLVGSALVAALTLLLPVHGADSASDAHALLIAADLRGQALLVFDPAQPASSRRIPLPGGPHELVQLRDGRVAVSLEQSGALAVADIGSGAVETVTTGGLPHGLAERDGVLYVTDRERDEVRRFAVGSWAELEPVVAGRAPHAVASLRGGGIAVANAADATLTIGDRTVPTSDIPETVAVASDGRIATAGAIGDVVDIFDSDGVLRSRTALGGRTVRVLFSPAGDVLVAALSARAAVALIGESGVPRIVPVGGSPDGLLFTSDGTLWVSDLTAGRLSAVDVVSGKVRSSFLVPNGAIRSTGALLALRHDGAVAGLLCALVRQ